MTMGTVLLVDDDVGMRLTMSRILERQGYRVLSASGGTAALALAADTPFDVALVDFRMPGMDGAETCARLGGLCPQARLYLVTAHVTPESAVAAEAGGPAGILFKPVDVGCLLALIAEAVGSPGPAAMIVGGV